MLIESQRNVALNGGRVVIIKLDCQNLLQTTHSFPNLNSKHSRIFFRTLRYGGVDNAGNLNELLNAVLGTTEDKAWGL